MMVVGIALAICVSIPVVDGPSDLRYFSGTTSEHMFVRSPTVAEVAIRFVWSAPLAIVVTLMVLPLLRTIWFVGKWLGRPFRKKSVNEQLN
jgi:hypothetical protein